MVGGWGWGWGGLGWVWGGVGGVGGCGKVLGCEGLGRMSPLEVFVYVFLCMSMYFDVLVCIKHIVACTCMYLSVFVCICICICMHWLTFVCIVICLRGVCNFSIALGVGGWIAVRVLAAGPTSLNLCWGVGLNICSALVPRPRCPATCMVWVCMRSRKMAHVLGQPILDVCPCGQISSTSGSPNPCWLRYALCVGVLLLGCLAVPSDQHGSVAANRWHSSHGIGSNPRLSGSASAAAGSAAGGSAATWQGHVPPSTYERG